MWKEVVVVGGLNLIIHNRAVKFKHVDMTMLMLFHCRVSVVSVKIPKWMCVDNKVMPLNDCPTSALISTTCAMIYQT